MTAVPIGINFFLTAHTVHPTVLGQAAEELGFESLWVPDHIVVPVDEDGYHRGEDRGAPEVYAQMPDPLVTLSFIAAVTSQLKLATGVCLVSQRHPLSLAKMVASLDRFSLGRLLLGVGAGWSRREMSLFGVPYEKRWAVTEETIEAMRILWKNGRGKFGGQYVQFSEVLCDPTPMAQAGPPVLIGGPPTKATFRRVAEWGSGWVPVFVTPEQVRAGRLGISQACAAIGRDSSEVEITVFAKDVGIASQERYVEAGADRMVLQLYNHPGTRMPFETWEAHHLSSGSQKAPSAQETLRVLEWAAKDAGVSPVLKDSPMAGSG